MIAWIIPGFAMLGFGLLAFISSRKIGTVRKDGRPHQVPWGIVMVFCVLGIFVALVHMINLAGFETGPEHGLLGRMGR